MRNNVTSSLDDWITLLEYQAKAESPEILSLLRTYASEARFGRSIIDDNLKNLTQGSSILEVGAGSLILSCQLVREGFSVLSVEPFGDGFSHFFVLQKLVLDVAHKNQCAPEIISIPAEEFETDKFFDFAFSINVMEHVERIDAVILQVVKVLKHRAVYRFICPNYLFPYEPHFNMPTLFSKRVTEMFFKNRIYSCQHIDDPAGTWATLNWISVPKIVRISKSMDLCKVFFRRDLLSIMILRVVEDPIFSARRPAWLKFILKWFTLLGLHKLTHAIPVTIQPVIDCSFINLNRI